jgi:hypothetical protein
MTITFLALEQWLNTNRWLIIHQETKPLALKGVEIPHTIIEAISPMGLAWTFTGENGVVEAWKNEMSVDTEAVQ